LALFLCFSQSRTENRFPLFLELLYMAGLIVTVISSV
jgi:uncharacterized membrane protein YhdT